MDDLIVTRWGARFQGRRFPCAIGRGGVSTAKREGDGATPVGAHQMLRLFYQADRLRPPESILPTETSGPSLIWSDDPLDPAYNRGLRARAHPYSHERMRRGDRLYDIVIETDWNASSPEPGMGSAIFVHCWKSARKPTAGCVAFQRSDLLWILARWRRWSRVLVQA
ncbi:MAG: L,D-transpeptidase family protein [Pseudomonadota bacterium]